MFGEETSRTMFISEAVQSAIFRPFPQGHEILHAEFRQTLDAFLEGACLSIGEDPDTKASHALMARVKPVTDEFFDFRITTPQPQIRAFGGFADKDVFVLVSWEYRKVIGNNFDAEVRYCKEEWQSLFGSTVPYKGKTIDEYLTNYHLV